MTESCSKNYCQDGLQVSFATESQEFDFGPGGLYGYYELKPNQINDRDFFIKPSANGQLALWSMWWDGVDSWRIGSAAVAGDASGGFGYYSFTDAFCPHQFSEGEWRLIDLNNGAMQRAGNHLVINCNCIFICTKKHILNFILKE